MFAFITELHKLKDYRKETLFIAFGLLDRFLAMVIKSGDNTSEHEIDLI